MIRKKIDMTSQTENLVRIVAETLHIRANDLIEAGLRVLLEQRLFELNTRIAEVTTRYDVDSVTEMESRY